MPKRSTAKIASLMNVKSIDTTAVDSSEDEKSSLSELSANSEPENSVSYISDGGDDLGIDLSKIDFRTDSESESESESDACNQSSNEYESDDEYEEEEKKYYPRLIIGDADCSYSDALIKKHLHNHPGLANKITVSDLKEEDELTKCYEEKFTEHAESLRNNGANLIFGVDGTQLHTNNNLTEARYPRIHFNFPHDGSNFKDQTLPEILEKFFASAKQKQEDGDRIYMAFPKLADADKNQFYKGYVYNIYENAAKSGYRLIKKRGFGKTRYPGYHHAITTRNQGAEIAEEAREYIFEKTNMTEQKIYNADRNNDDIGKRYINRMFYYTHKRKCLPEISTDNDSSEYEFTS